MSSAFDKAEINIVIPKSDNADENAFITSIGKSVSGTIISFNDGEGGSPVKNLIVDINAVQNLNGYDHPWVGGAGVNLLPPMADGTYSGNGVTAVVKDGVATFSGTTTSSGNALIIPLVSPFTVPSGTIYLHCLNSAVNATLAPAIENSQDTSQNLNYALSPANRITDGITNKTGQTYDRICFYIASGVTISGTYSPMICLDNTARSYVPYANICPISGWTGANVVRTGKNIAELTDPQLTTNVTQRVATLNYTGIFDVTISFDLVGAKYTASGVSLFNFVYNGSNHYVVPTSIYKTDRSTTIQLNTEYTGRFYYTWTNIVNPQYINMYFESASYGKWSGQMKNIQVELNSAPTSYESFQGQTTYSISWQTEAGTVYGGTLDVTTGVLTVDKKMYSIETNITYTHPSDWKVGAWTFTPTNNSDMESVSGYGTMADIISNIAPVDTPANIASLSKQNTAIGIGNGRSVFIYLGAEYDTQEKIKQVLSNTDACYVAPLATPQTYQLTPTEVQTVFGKNNIWSDSGDVEVTYGLTKELIVKIQLLL